MKNDDPYKILGIKKNSTKNEIKLAYKKLSLKYHPDRNKDIGAEDKFKEINSAYEILSDEKKKKFYDEHGTTDSFSNQYSSGFGQQSDFNDMFSDLFGDLFGNRTRKQKVKKGSDLFYKLTITLQEIVDGSTVSLKYNTLIYCIECKKTGIQKGSKEKICEKCSGSGKIKIKQGIFFIQQHCNNCNGNGYTIKEYCKKCIGEGRIKKTKIISIKIPRGVDSNNKIKIMNKGEVGKTGGPPGNLYIYIKIKKHPIFKKKNSDLYCNVYTKITSLILGKKIWVPTINGKILINIPKETQNNRIIKVREKGIFDINKNKNGNIYYKVIVQIKKITSEQKKILQDMEKKKH